MTPPARPTSFGGWKPPRSPAQGRDIGPVQEPGVHRAQFPSQSRNALINQGLASPLGDETFPANRLSAAETSGLGLASPTSRFRLYVCRGRRGKQPVVQGLASKHSWAPRPGRVSLLMLGPLKCSVPQFPHLRGEAMGPQPIYLVQGGGSAIKEEEASTLLALRCGGHCPPAQLNTSRGLGRVWSRSQLGYRGGRRPGLPAPPPVQAPQGGRQADKGCSLHTPAEHLESIPLWSNPPTPFHCPCGLLPVNRSSPLSGGHLDERRGV